MPLVYHPWGDRCPKFKDFILPLIFYKRLSDVFDDEFARHIEKFGDEAIAREITESRPCEDALKSGIATTRLSVFIFRRKYQLGGTSQSPRQW